MCIPNPLCWQLRPGKTEMLKHRCVCPCWCRCLHQCHQTMPCGAEAAHWPLHQELTPWPSELQQEVFHVDCSSFWAEGAVVWEELLFWLYESELGLTAAYHSAATLLCAVCQPGWAWWCWTLSLWWCPPPETVLMHILNVSFQCPRGSRAALIAMD